MAHAGSFTNGRIRRMKRPHGIAPHSVFHNPLSFQRRKARDFWRPDVPGHIPMTKRQRADLLALPGSETMVVRHYALDANDLAAVATARTPATRLGYALQLCALRYPGRHLRRGELMPAAMLDHIAEQVGVETDVIADFARRTPTRYDQLAAIKARFGFSDLSRPLRAELMTWLTREAETIVDGRVLLDRLLAEMRSRCIVIPGISVVERMAAEAMHRADAAFVATIDASLEGDMRVRLDALIDDKVHERQSRLSWLREPTPRVSSASLSEILEKVEAIRQTGAIDTSVGPRHEPRLTQFAREGVRYTAQAFQQMRPIRRRVVLVATLREMEATLTDAAIAMFDALVGRAHLRARKRLEQRVAASGREGRERLVRVANVLEAMTRAARSGADITLAVQAIAPLETIDADASIIRRSASPHKGDVLEEIAAEHRTFKRVGPVFLRGFDFQGRPSTAALRQAMTTLSAQGGDGRKPLPSHIPLDHIERRWLRQVMVNGEIDRTHWELATYSALADALASGAIWVPSSRTHRSLGVMLAAPPGASPRQAFSLGDPHAWLEERSARLDQALREVASNLGGRDPALFAGDRLRFPKDGNAGDHDDARPLALACYGMVPTTRITDVLSQVSRWTGFVDHFGHVSTGLPPTDERAFLATLIAEATNLGLARMAEVCGAASRRVLLRMQTWHMREETFRAALACLTDAIHAEPLAAWFGPGHNASADGQAYYLGGPGEAGGAVNAHYGRDPVVKIYTTVTDRYAPLHQTVIAGTAGEAIHALDGILGHDSDVDLTALHVDGGGVSDIVFAVMHLIGLRFEPRIPRLSDRRLYAFEPPRRYGRLAPLFGRRLNRELIVGHWSEIEPVIGAMRDRTVTPSLILRKLAAYRQQSSLAAALREVGRIERTLFTLRWFEDPALRRTVTAELNKGEARNSLARAVAFHRLGRFRDRGLENRTTRAAALNLVTAAIILFNCRYLSRAIDELRRQGRSIDPALQARLSPLGWDRINLTGDYVWSDQLNLGADGLMPLLTDALP
ncbi:Tn3 family transposase [Aurantimonas sp. VKM B-3413]|uniref:Tn3 family transposase n=1 Tax=Aurantimonas sp. VKM B-3413 TaxID=2779401 RepID=UPI001E511312|nr:Tn3 family transposase [Aurantimonas sp. VKM B-3413]MCB8835847.1 Tn3 family transposase [Aurantimonas sp. VKM B-3413]